MVGVWTNVLCRGGRGCDYRLLQACLLVRCKDPANAHDMYEPRV